MFDGLWFNIHVLLVAMVGVTILSTSITLMRTSCPPILFPLRILALIHTIVMRSMPIIVVLYLISFSIPDPGLFGHIDPSVFGTITVVMGYSAYVSKVLRAGFNDVHPSQRTSAHSLGLTSGQTTRLIVIPQALREVAPALMNDSISMQKDIDLISVPGAAGTMRAAQIGVASTYNLTPYVAASPLFILMSMPFIPLNGWYTKRLCKRRLSEGAV